MKIIPLGNKWLSRKNIPNALSLVRMLLVLPFLLVIRDIFVYECPKNWGLLLIFTIIILSDIADGFLARKLRCASNAGAKLDIISDALYTLFSLSAFAYFKIIPIWFILVLLFKLGEFIVTSKIVTVKQKSSQAVFFDKAGKLSVSAAMLLPGIFVFRCIIADYKMVMNAAIYIITVMLAISFVSRIINTIKVSGTLDNARLNKSVLP
ncbi:MAG: CDP-alcohol phosphatidyltransferase family protein [Treponema sp.]|nr:CDP-alcohol phosphatidyltransferase family protein [Treponema sp.]